MMGERLRRYWDSGQQWIFTHSETKTFLFLLQCSFQSWITLILSALSSHCCTWQVNRDWFWLYNPCIAEKAISTWGLTMFIFHSVGCYTWQRASAERPQTDPTHIQVNTDIWQVNRDWALLWLLFWNMLHQRTMNLLLRSWLHTHMHKKLAHIHTVHPER